MKQAVIYLGPPLGGKSTLAIADGAPRFSVRKWFEPRRSALRLPPVGTMLSDALVFDAVESFLTENSRAERIIMDGFPGNAAQLDWLVERLAGDYCLDWRYVPVDFETARRRSELRQVCFACDGGADPVSGGRNGRCPVCGAELGPREDDAATRFFRRWDQYAKRERQMLQAKHAGLLPPQMRMEKPETCPMDLHLHTTCSDGTQTPAEMVRAAAAKGLGLCAVTDHDCCDGVGQALAAGKACGIRVIPGVEINALWNGTELHLLGYGIDPDEESLREVCARNIRAVQAYDREVLRLAVQAGLISREAAGAYDAFSYDRRRGGWKLLNYMISLGVCRDGFEYLDMIGKLGPPKRAFVSVREAVDAISKSGICILAHPGIYRWTRGSLEDNLRALWGTGIRGLECYHSLHTQQTAQTLVDHCRRWGLLETGGSDDHGNLPERSVGTPYISSGILHKSMKD